MPAPERTIDGVELLLFILWSCLQNHLDKALLEIGSFQKGCIYIFSLVLKLNVIKINAKVGVRQT